MRMPARRVKKLERGASERRWHGLPAPGTKAAICIGHSARRSAAYLQEDRMGLCMFGKKAEDAKAD
jgi:hypothetical protein